MNIRRLDERHAAAIEELLVAAPLPNLFLLGYLDALPVGQAGWWGLVDGDAVLAAAILVPGKLMVPCAPNLEHAKALGAFWHRRTLPCMSVGPREQVDAVWNAWKTPNTRTDKFYDQRLYAVHKAQKGERPKGFRRATHLDLVEVAHNARHMEIEDLGRDPLDVDATQFQRTIERRIRQGVTWVIDRGGKIVFQINVGTRTGWGCQVGGTYVPPSHRGQGLSTLGMSALTRALLPRHRTITLHVNEANLPAVRCYERTGFERIDAFRLLTVADP